MKTVLKALCLTLLSLCLWGCGASRNMLSREGKIIIMDEPYRDNFTNSQLRNYIKKYRESGGMPTIVVRGSGQTSSISSVSGNHKIYSILETALSKNHFDVRDRTLFETVATTTARNGAGTLSYQDLSKATEVELLMEVTQYSLSDYYYVDGYYDYNNAFHRFERQNIGSEKEPQWISPTYVFRGMSISLKIIMLKDNLVGGSYSYSYIPCSKESGGAKITQMYPLRYYAEAEARDLDAMLEDGSNTSLLERKSQRLDRSMERFLSEVVIPGLMEDIEGVSRGYSPINDNNGGGNHVADIEGVSRGYSPINDNNGGGNHVAYISDKSVTLKKSADQLRGATKGKTDVQIRELLEEMKDVLSEGASKNSSLTENHTSLKRNDSPVEEYSSASIVAKNSFGKLTTMITEMIEKQFFAQVEDEKGNLKSQKKINAHFEQTSSLKTTLQRWQYLNEKAILDLNNFISTAISSAGDQKPEVDMEHFSFFIPSRHKVKADKESILLIFLNGQCVGVGSDSKGVYACLETNQYTAPIYQLVVAGVRVLDKKKEKKELFKSDISIDIRNDYEFERELHHGIIRVLKLK